MEQLICKRIVPATIRYISFDGKIKIVQIETMDILKEDVESIFNELFEMEFPIYSVICKEPFRKVTEKGRISLHSYGAAIDINELINPYFNIQTKTMDPRRKNNRKSDKKTIEKTLSKWNLSDGEKESVLQTVIQENGSDDRFLNRNILRKGMVTPAVVEIFKRHGFNVWGGNWRQPMDYMHFQIPRHLAEELIKSKSNEAKSLWVSHKQSCNTQQ